MGAKNIYIFLKKLYLPNKKNTEKGQAIFELVFFIPIFIILIPYFISIGNSINQSINQQKASRRYFFYLAKGNSMLPSNFDLKNWQQKGGITFASLTSTTWGQKKIGQINFAYCSSLPSFLRPDSSEICDNKSIQSGTMTSGFIHINSAFGLCGSSNFFDQNANTFTSNYQNLGSMATACYTSQ